MLQEIREQPRALERTLDAELAGVEELSAPLSKQRPKLIVLAARGTSDNAAHVRPLSARDHHRHSGLAGRAVGIHDLWGESSTARTPS